MAIGLGIQHSDGARKSGPNVADYWQVGFRL
jgi:hypothetical protein